MQPLVHMPSKKVRVPLVEFLALVQHAFHPHPLHVYSLLWQISIYPRQDTIIFSLWFPECFRMTVERAKTVKKFNPAPITDSTNWEPEIISFTWKKKQCGNCSFHVTFDSNPKAPLQYLQVALYWHSEHLHTQTDSFPGPYRGMRGARRGGPVTKFSTRAPLQAVVPTYGNIYTG